MFILCRILLEMAVFPLIIAGLPLVSLLPLMTGQGLHMDLQCLRRHHTLAVQDGLQMLCFFAPQDAGRQQDTHPLRV